MFDAKAPAASSTALTLQVLLDPSRAARLQQYGTPDFAAVIDALLEATVFARPTGGVAGAIQRQTNLQVLYALMRLAFNSDADGEVRALAHSAVSRVGERAERQSGPDATWRAHFEFLRFEIERLRHDPSQMDSVSPVTVPPGSPIGSYQAF